MKRLDEIFYICYGSQLDLNKCDICGKGQGFNFVNRSNSNCGVSARILRVDKKEPFKAGLITVAMGGSVLSSFVQQEDFYTGQNVKVLEPIEEMGLSEKLFYCQCIEANRFRFSTFGREANYTFDSLLVPSREDVPQRIRTKKICIPFNSKPFSQKKIKLNVKHWQWFEIGSIFNVKPGKFHYPSEYVDGETPYLSATSLNNGLSTKIDLDAEFKGNVITTEKVKCKAFYQPYDFCATSDVNVIMDNGHLNKFVGLFIATVIDFNENFRWTYGRQCRKEDTKSIRLKLPAINTGLKDKSGAPIYEPDWQFMEDYIKSLPYSACI